MKKSRFKATPIPFIRPLPLDGLNFSGSLFLIDGTELHNCHVPEQIYVTEGSDVTVYQFRNGNLFLLPQSTTNTPGYKHKGNANRKQRYHNVEPSPQQHPRKHYLVSHLVYMAFVGPIPADKPHIDHLDGITTNNHWSNLEPVTNAENNRRARYLHVLRECGFDPRIFTANQLREFFAVPFDEFKTTMYHHKND